jgi:hypothetical protein
MSPPWLAAKVSFRVHAPPRIELTRTPLSTASLSLSGRSLPIGSIALRQSCHYINNVFLLFDKLRVAALFERKKLRSWNTLTNFQLDAPLPNMPVNLYIVE